MKWTQANCELYWHARWEHVRRLRQEGLLLKEIGFRMGVSKSCVSVMLQKGYRAANNTVVK
jgi:hypothetical protein